MGNLFKCLLSSLDSCEKEVERIFHINARIKIRDKNNNCSCRHNFKPHHKEENLYCDCECECDCIKK